MSEIRPYFHLTIDQLESLVKEHTSNVAVTGDIRAELTFRDTQRARHLLRELEALHCGRLNRPPGPPRPDSPEDQGTLL